MAVYPNVAKKYERNLAFCAGDDFVEYMIDNIPDYCDFRIHVSGDFYSVEYVEKWREIVEERQDVTFYAYTRSWRIPAIWNAIRRLHLENENCNVNLSVDDETGVPRVFGAGLFRRCYLTKTDNVPDWIRENDIIFRSNHLGQKRRRKNDIKKGIDPNIRSPLVKRLGGRVCPLEQGQDIPGFSCKKCTLCVVEPMVLTSA